MGDNWVILVTMLCWWQFTMGMAESLWWWRFWGVGVRRFVTNINCRQCRLSLRDIWKFDFKDLHQCWWRPLICPFLSSTDVSFICQPFPFKGDKRGFWVGYIWVPFAKSYFNRIGCNPKRASSTKLWSIGSAGKTLLILFTP